MYYRRSDEEVRVMQKPPHQLVVSRSFVGNDPDCPTRIHPDRFFTEMG